MAQIEIYVRLKGDKKWHLEAQINAASQGAMRLYYALEEKYLPSYDLKNLGYSDESIFVFKESAKMNKLNDYVHRTCLCNYIEQNPMQEIWDLGWDKRITYEEHIVFMSTMDNAKILGKDIPLFIDCLEKVYEEHKGNFHEQAEALRKIYSEYGNKISAIVYNQTSVCSGSEFLGQNYDFPLKSFWNCIITREEWDEFVNSGDECEIDI